MFYKWDLYAGDNDEYFHSIWFTASHGISLVFTSVLQADILCLDMVID